MTAREPTSDVMRLVHGGQAHDVVILLQKAVEFTRELMEENARLRREHGKHEVASQKLTERYAAIAEQSDILQSLFVVIHRLHATLDPNEVVMTIKEVLVDLIGCKRFSLWWHESETGQYTPISHGGDEGLAFDLHSLELGDELVQGEAWFAPDNGPAAAGQPVAVVPLKIGDKTVGLIVIHELLAHKKQLRNSDMQILDLLSGQGAVALATARLWSERGGR